MQFTNYMYTDFIIDTNRYHINKINKYYIDKYNKIYKFLPYNKIW